MEAADKNDTKVIPLYLIIQISENEKPKEEEVKNQEQVKPKKRKNNQPKEVLTPEELFSKCDLRVGKLVEVTKHPESNYLYCTKIDIGTEIREIGTGLQEVVPLEKMVGLVIVIANLKPKGNLEESCPME